MLSHADNETLTRTDPATPLGQAIRRYWIPALMTSEIPEPNGPPVRVKLLGEELVAFRDSQGRVGLLDELCPHRLASLFLGRNEECGLRCVYHGWKFDVTGNCLDMMNEPTGSDFHTKVQTKSYPTLEQGGLVWTYMGPAENSRRRPTSSGPWLPKPTGTSPRTFKNATGSRAWRGESILPTRPSCTAPSAPKPKRRASASTPPWSPGARPRSRST